MPWPRPLAGWEFRQRRVNPHTGPEVTGVTWEPPAHLGGVVLSVVRIIVSFLFVLHGAAALFGVLTPGGMPTPVGLWPSWWAGLIQFVGGGLVLLGLFTTPAALLCSGTMA